MSSVPVRHIAEDGIELQLLLEELDMGAEGISLGKIDVYYRAGKCAIICSWERRLVNNGETAEGLGLWTCQGAQQGQAM